MDKVILLGQAMYDTTKAQVAKLVRHCPGIELWVCNGFWKAYGSHWYDPTRIFQVHSNEDMNKLIAKKNIIGDYPVVDIYNKTGARVVACEHLDNINRQELFPIEYMSKYGKNFYTSSFSYMMAMAIEESFKEIHVLGFQMMSMGPTEHYKDQLPQARYGIRKARENGAKVIAEFESEWNRSMKETDIESLFEVDNPYIYVEEYKKAAGA